MSANEKNDVVINIDDTLSQLNYKPSNEIVWKPEHDKILVEWADKAMCYRWLHAKSNTRYSYLNAWFTIPVIVISTITGTANFAQDRFGEDYKSLAVMVIGGFNIFAGIITTIQQFLKITQLNESHRACTIAWDKFYRNVKIELSKHPTERTPVDTFLKSSKEEYDRLMETSPIIPTEVIKQFKSYFKDDVYSKISRPEVCDVLISTEESKYQEKKDKSINTETNPNTSIDDIAVNDIDEKIKTIEQLNHFCKKFQEIHGRHPIRDEIKEHFKLNYKGDIEMAVGNLYDNRP
jgi:hypothetical protein